VIARRFHNIPAVLIGGGPSLTRDQVELFRALHRRGHVAMFGCNDAYRICDFLDCLYAADGKWIEHHHAQVINALGDRVPLVTVDKPAAAKYPEWIAVPDYNNEPGLSRDPTTLHAGQHSGYQLIGLAYHMGVRTAVLLGYDCHSGGQHWFGEHPTDAMRVRSNFERWVKHYDTIAADAHGMRIINATPGSAIRCFEMMAPEDAAAELRGVR